MTKNIFGYETDKDNLRYPNSKDFPTLTIGEMECNIIGLQENIHTLSNSYQGVGLKDRESHKKYCKNEIKRLQQKINQYSKEIIHRRRENDG